MEVEVNRWNDSGGGDVDVPSRDLNSKLKLITILFSAFHLLSRFFLTYVSCSSTAWK